MPIAATVFLLLALIILIAMPAIWWVSLILFVIALGIILLCIFICKYIDKKIRNVISIEKEIDRQNAMREKTCADTQTDKNAVDQFNGDVDE